MANFKEIVTKSVIGKGKKCFTTTNTITPNDEVSTILGCWVINHNFSGQQTGDCITIEGCYDVNIWYSCNNDTRTELAKSTDTYTEVVSVPRRSEPDIRGGEEVLIRSLRHPNCIKVEIIDGRIVYSIQKELGIEIVGDTKVRIAASEEEEEWDIIEDENDCSDALDAIEEQVNEEFLY